MWNYFLLALFPSRQKEKIIATSPLHGVLDTSFSIESSIWAVRLFCLVMIQKLSHMCFCLLLLQVYDSRWWNQATQCCSSGLHFSFKDSIDFLIKIMLEWATSMKNYVVDFSLRSKSDDYRWKFERNLMNLFSCIQLNWVMT